MMHRLSLLLPAGLVLAVGLSGCITSTTSSAPGTAPGGRSRTTATQAEAAKPSTEQGQAAKKSSTEKAAAAKPLPDLGAAKEISGKDQDGKEFKLSDYRGKVVMLDFWAGW